MSTTPYQPMSTTPLSGGDKRQKIASIRTSILKALFSFSAFNADSAKRKNDIAARARVLPIDVAHHLYKDNPLSTLGYVAQCRIEGERGLGYFLTPKGRKLVKDNSREELIALIFTVPSVNKRQ